MVTIDTAQPTSTYSVTVESYSLTTPRTAPTKARKDPKPQAWRRPLLGQHTGLDVDPAERGSEDERNQAESLEADSRHDREKTAPIHDAEGSRVRSELARDLIQRVKTLVPLVGDVSIATQIGLLKRDLARCHDSLKSHPAERNFLSIVTFIESAISQLKWKQYTGQQLDAISKALETGYRQVRVNFTDYEAARLLFSQQKVDATPRIDLSALKLDDISDDEEE